MNYPKNNKTPNDIWKDLELMAEEDRKLDEFYKVSWEAWTQPFTI